MLGRFVSYARRHLVAFTALFIVLGGSAVALPGKESVEKGDLAKGSVTKKAIKKNAVTDAKIKGGAVTDAKIKDGAVTTAKVADGAVTGAKADEDSFRGLIKGEGEVFSRAGTVDATGLLATPVLLADVPGFAQIRLVLCSPFSGNSEMRVQMDGTADQEFLGVGEVTASDLPAGLGNPELIEMSGGIYTTGGEILAADISEIPTAVGGPDAPGAFGIAAKWDFQLSRGSGADAKGAHVSVSAFNSSSSTTAQGQCQVTAQTVLQD